MNIKCLFEYCYSYVILFLMHISEINFKKFDHFMYFII